jgi:hypothetical protein
MTTHSVVEDLDVFPDCRYGLVVRLEMSVHNSPEKSQPSVLTEPVFR